MTGHGKFHSKLPALFFALLCIVFLFSCSEKSINADEDMAKTDGTTAAADAEDINDNCETEDSAMDEVKEEKQTVDFGIWFSTWYAYTAESSKSNRTNTWTAWDIPYRPLLPDGSCGMYDSSDRAAVDYYIGAISDAQIDFIIMDQTNNIDVDGGYINERSIATANACIRLINGSPERHPVRYCSAIGGVQFSGDPAAIENEAKMLFLRYDTSPKYHYCLDGKPLLIVYLGNYTEELWNDYKGDRTYSSKFTIRFADNASRPGYYGWAYDKGTQLDDEVSVIMPGWDNRKGAAPVKRRSGEWYEKQLDVIRKAGALPKIIVINSFNEYAEGTAVWCADTDLEHNSDKWTNASGELDAGMYWKMTTDFIAEIRER